MSLSSDGPSSASISRTQRCGVCEGCLAKACGVCVYCKDNPQFGGPGVKKQSCVARRCVRVLESKLQREAMGARAKRGCGVCDECRDADCGACLICMDKRFFQGQFLPSALCAKKKCSNARPLEINPSSAAYDPAMVTDRKLMGEQVPKSNGATPSKKFRDDYDQQHQQQQQQQQLMMMKRRKLDYSPPLSRFSPTDPNVSPVLRATVQSNAQQHQHPQQPSHQQMCGRGPPEAVSLMERAFSYVIHPHGDRGNPQQQQLHQHQQHQQQPLAQQHQQHQQQSNWSRQPVQPRQAVMSANAFGQGASPPAGSVAPVYRTLPVATPAGNNGGQMVNWNLQQAKVLYPTSVEPVSLANAGLIVTLDGEQLKQHLANNSTTLSQQPQSGDPEDIELQQKLIEFYQRDKQQQQHAPYSSNFMPHHNSQGQFHYGQSTASKSALPPSIVVEPMAPMGQSEVILQQL